MTTLVIGRCSSPSPWGEGRSRWFATHTCPMISATVRSRLKPWRPVEQNLQSRAQPTCEETQSVPRSSSGMKTVSMPFPTPTSNSHFTVPSAERCSERIAGARTSAVSLSISRSDFARFVIASKSATPRWCTHWKTCFARNGFSPCAANHSVSWGSVKSRRLVFVTGRGSRSRGRNTRSRWQRSRARRIRARRWRRWTWRSPRGSCPSPPSSDRSRP